MTDFWGMVLSWVPMIALIVVWVFFMTRTKYPEYMRDQIDAINKQNDLLERIAVALEKREP